MDIVIWEALSKLELSATDTWLLEPLNDMQPAQTFDAQDTLWRVPVFPFPEESAVTVPRRSLKSHSAIRSDARFVAALMFNARVVDAAVPPPEPAMTTENTPVGAEADVVRVRVELQVAMQLEIEKVAVTPAGSDGAEKPTETGKPEISAAVIPSVTDCPRINEMLGAAADKEIAVGRAAVIKVESAETVEPPLELVELTRK